MDAGAPRCAETLGLGVLGKLWAVGIALRSARDDQGGRGARFPAMNAYQP